MLRRITPTCHLWLCFKPMASTGYASGVAPASRYLSWSRKQRTQISCGAVKYDKSHTRTSYSRLRRCAKLVIVWPMAGTGCASGVAPAAHCLSWSRKRAKSVVVLLSAIGHILGRLEADDDDSEPSYWGSSSPWYIIRPATGRDGGVKR
jgi:hypothetical protein